MTRRRTWDPRTGPGPGSELESAQIGRGFRFVRIQVRIQTQSHTNPTYSGLADCVSKTWKAEGAAGSYKGMSSPLVGQMFFNAVQFAAYGQAKDLVCKGKEMTIANYFEAGALTGFVIAFVECPIDLFKTQLQTQVFNAKPQFTTFLGTVGHIFRHHGVRGCFQGLAPTICRNVPAVSGYFGAYEAARLALLAPGQKLEAAVGSVRGGYDVTHVMQSECREGGEDITDERWRASGEWYAAECERTMDRAPTQLNPLS
jgi:hypothetical protein